MSEAVTATGILVKRALLASPTVFTVIGEIVSVSPPGFSRNKIETSTHNEGAESNVLGILRQKDPSFRVNWIGGDATHASVMADMAGNTKNQWQIAYPSGVKFTGPARVSRCEMVDAPVDAAQQADITLTWTGPAVYAAS
jgi:hypothetical protein